MLEFSLFPRFYFPAVPNMLFFCVFLSPSSHMWLVRFTIILAGYPTDSTPQNFSATEKKNSIWVIWNFNLSYIHFPQFDRSYSHKIVCLIMSLWLPRGVRKLAEQTLLWNCHHVSGFLKSYKFSIERNTRRLLTFRTHFPRFRHLTSTLFEELLVIFTWSIMLFWGIAFFKY